jgi:AraC-like DNA-binding protein
LRVGYESESQFSREFTRLFGDGPAAVAEQLRKSLTRLA